MMFFKREQRVEEANMLSCKVEWRVCSPGIR